MIPPACHFGSVGLSSCQLCTTTADVACITFEMRSRIPSSCCLMQREIQRVPASQLLYSHAVSTALPSSEQQLSSNQQQKRRKCCTNRECHIYGTNARPIVKKEKKMLYQERVPCTEHQHSSTHQQTNRQKHAVPAVSATFRVLTLVQSLEKNRKANVHYDLGLWLQFSPVMVSE